MASRIVSWTKERVLKTLFKNFHQRFWQYFYDLPSALSLHGFFDKFVLTDVYLDATKINADLYTSDVPFHMAFGHIGLAEFNSESVIVLKEVFLVLHVNYSGNPTSLLNYTVEKIFHEIKSIFDCLSKPPSSGEDAFHAIEPNNILNEESSGALSWKEISAWLFRYDPNLVIRVKNVHIRVESAEAPFNAIGIVLDSLRFKPGDASWVLRWPEAENPESKLTIQFRTETKPSTSSTCDTQSGSSDANQPNVRHPIDEESLGKAIFIGALKGFRIYIDTDTQPWVSLDVLRKVFEQHTHDSPRNPYHIISPQYLHKLAQKTLQSCHFLVPSLSLNFQFGLKRLEEEDQCGGMRLIVVIVQPLRILFSPAVILVLTSLYGRMMQFPTRKTLERVKYLDRIENANTEDAKYRWRVVQYFVRSCCLFRSPRSASLCMFLKLNVNCKRRFMGFVRESLLHFHLVHPMGRFKMMGQFPLVYFPFQLLDQSFVLGNVAATTLDAESVDKLLYPLSYLCDPRIAVSRPRNSQFVSLSDFARMGMAYPPPAYFYLSPGPLLNKVLGKNFGFIADIMRGKGFSVVAKWYLLAVREVEELLRSLWYCLIHSKPFLAARSYDAFYGDSSYTALMHKLLGCFESKVVIQHLASTFEKNIPSVAEDTNDFNIPYLLNTFSYSARLRRKLKTFADFFDVYVAFIRPDVPEELNLIGYLRFKELLRTDGSKMTCDSVMKTSCGLNKQPERSIVGHPIAGAEHIDRCDYHAIYPPDHDKDNLQEGKRLPWTSLLKQVKEAGVDKYAVSSLRWNLPQWLSGLTFGIVIDMVEIRYTAGNHSMMYPLVYGVQARAVGFELQCERRVGLNLVFRDLLLLNFALDRQGYPFFSDVVEDLRYDSGLILAGVSSEELVHVDHPSQRPPQSPEATPYQPCGTSGSSIPFVIQGDNGDDDDDNHSAENNLFDEIHHSNDQTCNDPQRNSPVSDADSLQDIPFREHYTSINTIADYGAETTSTFQAINSDRINKSEKYYWNALSLSCISPAVGNENCSIQLPLYLDIQIVVVDIHTCFRPLFFDQLHDIFLECVETCRHASEELRVTSPHASIFTQDSPPSGINAATLQNMSSWIAHLLYQYFSHYRRLDDPQDFWSNRLARHLALLRTRHTTHPSQKKFFSYLNVLHRLSSIENGDLTNLHVQIRVVIPPLRVFFFPVTNLPPYADHCVAELQCQGDTLLLATVRRGIKVHFVVLSSHLYFTTRSDIQHFVMLIPALFHIIQCRWSEMQGFVKYHSNPNGTPITIKPKENHRGTPDVPAHYKSTKTPKFTLVLVYADPKDAFYEQLLGLYHDYFQLRKKNKKNFSVTPLNELARISEKMEEASSDEILLETSWVTAQLMRG